MQKKTKEHNLRLAESTRSGNIDAIIAKETPGGVVAMTPCQVCGKPAIYTLQSVFVCVPCRYTQPNPKITKGVNRE